MSRFDEATRKQARFKEACEVKGQRRVKFGYVGFKQALKDIKIAKRWSKEYETDCGGVEVGTEVE